MQPKSKFILEWADNNMILGQRLSEWCGHGPALELDIALTNIALDLIGEARLLYQYIGEIEQKEEDFYPFLRKENEFFNAIITEVSNGDFGMTIMRQYLYDVFHYFYLEELTKCGESRFEAIASKCLKEARYHLKFSSEWVIRLGDGTEESKVKIQSACDKLLPLQTELFNIQKIDDAIFDLTSIKLNAEKHMNHTFELSTLKSEKKTSYLFLKGKEGFHTEEMGYLLAIMQNLQRTYPDSKW